MKPIIGVTASMEVDGMEYKMNLRNIRAIEQTGGIPVILPYYHDYQDIEALLDKIDGLYLPGGYDIDPSLFGDSPHPKLGIIIPERDRLENEVISYFLDKDKPILGVCRGCQILNVVTGGTMYQDLDTQYTGQLIQHTQKAAFHHRSHSVNITPSSLLGNLVQATEIKVNSFHHQANRTLGKDFMISAVAADGVMEAFESKIHRFVLGVQWHPEGLVNLSDDRSLAIYQGFIQACK
ncbi:gamma-glutamyl-gamma-aminobutyrate hydrolase family protein [Oceanobacillus sp. J11TS1]|uniref:gamma-glutamyl-gamma-aminobutyrate hydrolase family protein n=1 Tax=Oceanobacillus sp. J11TS1 TaxID=2807191 RepID=UPI001AFEDD23|nr:gamma-glutamyl-gamma-aminobutyrate hydrolase family protein [Oceanobacillus sp. J11TS1]GIO22787.1 gamma-glutamyl-gamma-aminobutyrate hydrolase [Oceanobacillus sp. J11TS1]